MPIRAIVISLLVSAEFYRYLFSNCAYFVNFLELTIVKAFSGLRILVCGNIAAVGFRFQFAVNQPFILHRASATDIGPDASELSHELAAAPPHASDLCGACSQRRPGFSELGGAKLVGRRATAGDRIVAVACLALCAAGAQGCRRQPDAGNLAHFDEHSDLQIAWLTRRSGERLSGRDDLCRYVRHAARVRRHDGVHLSRAGNGGVDEYGGMAYQ